MHPLSAPLALALLVPVLANLASAQTTWTVDDNGPADFSDLQAAADAASDGDILLIENGGYGTLETDKALTLLGNPAFGPPRIAAVRIDGAERVDLAHLEFDELLLANIPGRSHVDDCFQDPLFGALEIVFFRNMGELIVQDSSFTAMGTAGSAPDRIQVSGDSRVVFVNCELRGGNGVAVPASSEAGHGGNALKVLHSSSVTLAGCDVRGGDGESLGLFGPLGSGGHGVELIGDADCDVRGSSFHGIQGGLCEFPGSDGFSLVNNGTGALRRSGVTLVNPEGPGVTWILPAAPYLEIVGDYAPGATRRLRFFGEPGAFGLVFTGLAPALLELPALNGIEAWLDIGQLFQVLPFIMQGQDTPVNSTWILPASAALAGVTLNVQGATEIFGAPGQFSGTNPATILLSF